MIRILVLLPVLILLVAFALSNPQPVALAMWPTDLSIEAPLSIAVLIFGGITFFVGALIVWVSALSARRRAARAERRVARLEAELGARIAAPALTNPRIAPPTPTALATR